jgi:hypothetical protein
LPDTVLDEARAALYVALQSVWQAMGWPAERASDIPPKQLMTPGAFVDVPVLAQAPTEAARAVAATFPLVFAVDGANDAQVRVQDKLLAYGWQEVAAVKVRGHRVTIQTAGPEMVDVGGTMARGLVFRVQLTVQTQTLCPQPLVQTDE